MYLRKTIVLVALAAVTAAPSALAQLPPGEGFSHGLKILKHGTGLRPNAKSHTLCGGRRLQVGHRCFDPAF